jgi:NADPH-dependent 2,4-dienoyl-CoA reductase/sulfur reductase-like enzyme
VLDDGQTLEADLVVIGVGVRPNLSLAEEAGLATDRGISVSEQLETSVAGIFAAGDIVRWPDSHTGQRIRVEHWVVAEQQGQVAARNLLGAREPFRAAPFFWSAHYDVTIAYVGHATEWDRVDIQGNIEDRDCVLAYRSGGKTLAVASIFRDKDSLTAAIAMERGDSAVLRSLAASR